MIVWSVVTRDGGEVVSLVIWDGWWDEMWDDEMVERWDGNYYFSLFHNLPCHDQLSVSPSTMSSLIRCCGEWSWDINQTISTCDWWEMMGDGWWLMMVDEMMVDGRWWEIRWNIYYVITHLTIIIMSSHLIYHLPSHLPSHREEVGGICFWRNERKKSSERERRWEMSWSVSPSTISSYIINHLPSHVMICLTIYHVISHVN